MKNTKTTPLNTATITRESRGCADAKKADKK